MIYLDFETRGIVDLKRCGATRYAIDPHTQVLCFCWSFDHEEDVWLWHRNHPWIEAAAFPTELCGRIADGEPVEAHNAGFEFSVWNNTLCRHDEFPEFREFPLTLEQMRCSAAKASCVSLPRGLGEALKAIGAPPEFCKLEDGQRLINKLSKPMPRRRSGRSTEGEEFKKSCRFDIYEAMSLGGYIATQDGYKIGEAVALRHPNAPNLYHVHCSVRDILQREAGEGPGGKKTPTLKRHGEGYICVRLPELKERQGYEQHLDAGPVWCEEEDEHRRNWVYCGQDIRGERYLSDWCPEMTERELDYWRMDQRMNLRGITLDEPAAERASELCAAEVIRLDAEMLELTGGVVPGGGKRGKFKAWVNDAFGDITFLPDTKADTLSFALHGVPTKAAESAKAARKDDMDARWAEWGERGKVLHRAMEISMEVNRTSNSKYKAMNNSVCPDGRLHDIMLYNGADRTGRWSGKGVQPHNFVRGYAKEMPEVWDDIKSLDRDMIEVIWGDPLPVLAKACRGALVASPGYELYAADFKAIEARKLAWMANCISQLELFIRGDGGDPNADPYLAMATAIYKRECTKADKDERQLGKRAVLGLGYQMAWEKFQATVWREEGIWLDDEFCQMVVRVYRKEQCPEVPMLWRAVGDAAIGAVTEGGEWTAGGDELGQGSISYFMSDNGHFLHCRLPSGRLLAYLYPEVHTKLTWRFHALNAHDKPCYVTFPSKLDVPTHRARWQAEKLAPKQNKRLTADPPENFPSPHLSFMGRHIVTKKWVRLGTHGGSLTENADQASSRDLLAEAMYRIDQLDDFRLLLSIHDEVIAEAPIGAATVKEFEALMSEVPLWATGMPISAEGWKGPRLRK